MTTRPECQQCSLSHNPILPVPFPTPLMFVGEAPGHEEVAQRKFFVGKAGKEKDQYLRMVGIPLDLGFTTNILKCRPPDDRDPKPAEILACSGILLEELSIVRPQIIATLGRFATRFFLGDVDMENVHGIPFAIDHVKMGNTTRMLGPTIIVPLYHPAFGLHDTKQMSLIMADFQALADVLHNKLEPRNIVPDYPQYIELIEHTDGHYDLLKSVLKPLIAIDTETEDNRAWCLTFCCEAGRAYMVRREYDHMVHIVAQHVANPNVLTILHNALFDLPILAQMYIYPRNFVDTMDMAYLLQTEPQGLKALAYRHLGMEMDSYSDMVNPYTMEKVLKYLESVLLCEWPKPDAVLEWVKNQPKIRQPQTIERRVKNILNDYGKDPSVDLLARWHKIDGRGMVEDALGPAEPAYLSDIPREDATYYACRDADATFQLYPILSQRIRAMGLEDTMLRDMRAMPMVADMQLAGMKIDREYFKELEGTFQSYMDDLNHQISQLAGEDVNPGSPSQISDLLFRKRIFRKRGSTDHAHLEPFRKYPLVDLIMQWRAYDKLLDSYIKVLPKKAGLLNDRVHTTLRVTRVITGRLASSNPNLMAQPVRTEDGRKIRGGFIAEEGRSLISGDYSQVEMRVTADISQDPVMVALFQAGEDIHSATASAMFGLPQSQLDEMLHRYPAKRVGFGILNSISPEGLLRELTLGGAVGWTIPRCQDLINNWFDIYAGVRSWIESQKAHARRHGLVRDMFGRMRLVPEMTSSQKRVVSDGLRQACNAPIQMGAQGIIKEAMGQLVPFYREFGGELIPLIQIHDDILWEVKDELLPVVVPMIKSVMEGAVKLSVPLQVDMKVGKRWNEMEKWECK